MRHLVGFILDPRTSRSRISVFAALLVALTASVAHAQISVSVVLQDGDQPPGIGMAEIDKLENPFTNTLGQPGFLGELDNGDHYIWINDAIVWLGTDEMSDTLTFAVDENAESMGFSNTGQWIYMPTISGTNGLWTNSGSLLREGDLAPGYSGELIQTLSRPTMTDDGQAYWVAFIDSNGDMLEDQRALYRSSDATLANAMPILKTGDMVTGFPLDATGVEIDYAVSSGGTHYIAVISRDTGSGSDNDGVAIDGALVLQESVSAAGDGGMDFFDNFDLVAINESGNYLVSGNTDNVDTTIDEYLAYNGVVRIREGDTVDGVSLTTPAELRGFDIDDSGVAVHLWSTFGDIEYLFSAPNAADLAGTSKLLLRTDDMVDIDNDGMADAVIKDFKARASKGPGINLSNDPYVYVTVDLDTTFDGVGDTEAIIQVPLSICGDGIVDPGEQCDDTVESATCNADCSLSMCGDSIVNATAGENCDTGGVETVSCDLDCTEVACGDGTTNTTAAEQCDDAGESMTCDIDCSAAMCGDGTVNATASEDCDTAGILTANCDLDCTNAVCGDSTINPLAGEVCDDGGESAACNADCTTAVCGDGVVNGSAGETCDAAGESATCDFDCTTAVCGDGAVNGTAGEDCDTSGESAGCDVDCTFAQCGDGDINTQAGEDCDDSGESATCDADCTNAVCGDNVVNTSAGEQCDTGGQTDGCNADCTFANCGDGVVNSEVGEQCDDGGESATCNDNCTPAMCGDNVVNETAGEQCDTSGQSAGCNADCTFSTCGDSIVNSDAGEVCDDGGQSASCNADCTASACGDGVLNTAAGEACEDGNTVDGDGCSAACLIEEPEDDGGCGCTVAGHRDDAPIRGALILLAMLGVAVVRVRRRDPNGA